MPSFSETLKSIRGNMDFTNIDDLCELLVPIESNARIGFSSTSFIRQARRLRAKWLADVCVGGGGLCIPPGTGAAIFFRTSPEQRSFQMVLINDSRMVCRGYSVNMTV